MRTNLTLWLKVYQENTENWIFNSEKEWQKEFEEFKTELRKFWASQGVKVNW